jgi:hypothetical protein
MTRTAVGTTSETFANRDSYAPLNAEKVAAYDLQRKLNDDCDAVPCLECGRYQVHMVEALKRDYQLGWRNLGRACLGAGIVTGIMWLIYIVLYEARSQEIALWLAIAAAALTPFGAVILLIRRRQLSRFEPNESDLAERMQVSARYARTLEQFKDYLQLQGIEWAPPPAMEEYAPSADNKNVQTEGSLRSRNRRRGIEP